MRRAAKVDGNQSDIVDALRMWRCMECGAKKVATAHQNRQKYCSRECAAKAYKSRMIGSANPNFKNAGNHMCLCCGVAFHAYEKDRKYCSHACYAKHNIDSIRERALKGARAAKPRATAPLGHRCKCKACGVEFRHPSKRLYCDEHRSEARAAQGSGKRPSRVSVKVTATCAQCSKDFTHYPAHDRKYCSYQCHLDSGGAYRAGKAAGTMTRKYGAKKDANHGAMVGAFKKLGAQVLDLSALGNGVPDLVVWCSRRWVLVDVKNPKTGYGRRGLNKNQREWADAWQGGPVYLVATLEDVVSLVTGKFDLVKHYPEDREPSPEEASDKPITHIVETAEQAIAILTREAA